MRHIRTYCNLFIICILASCSNRYDARIQLVKAYKTITLTADTTIAQDFCGMGQSLTGIQIVNDTLLVLQGQINDNITKHFSVYSTNSRKFLGSIIQNGRGPDEMVSPRIVRTDNHLKHLVIKDNMLNIGILVDIEKSLDSDSISIFHRFQLPKETVDWVYISDTVQYTLCLKEREFVFNTIHEDGSIINTFEPYSGIDAINNSTYLSSCLLCNNTSSYVANVMLFSPQIDFIDLKSGKTYSMAVDPDYKKWTILMNKPISMKTMQYYSSATSTPDLIFATYKGRTLEEINQSTSIHVFDWKGKLLYDLKVKENISELAFDSKSKQLYCIDMTLDRVIRYNLSGLL